MKAAAANRYLFSFNTVPNQELEKLLPALGDAAGKSVYMFGADYVWPQKMFRAPKRWVTGMGGTVAGKEFTPWGVKDFRADHPQDPPIRARRCCSSPCRVG